MSFSVRPTEEEKKLEYDDSKLHSEDECDAATANEAYAEYVKEGMKSRPIEELWKKLGI